MRKFLQKKKMFFIENSAQYLFAFAHTKRDKDIFSHSLISCRWKLLEDEIEMTIFFLFNDRGRTVASLSRSSNFAKKKNHKNVVLLLKLSLALKLSSSGAIEVGEKKSYKNISRCDFSTFHSNARHRYRPINYVKSFSSQKI